MAQVTRSELATVIAKNTLNIKDSNKLAKTVAAYLIAEKQIAQLESLMRDVLAYREANGVIEAEVASAHELSDEVMREVKGLIKQHYPDSKHIVTHGHIDDSVIGGLKVTTANEQLDLSVRSKLDIFRRLTEEIN